MTTESNGVDLSADLSGLLPLALGVMSSAFGEENEAAAAKAKLRAWANEDPMDALLATVIGGGIAFYLVEKSTHPELANPWDGILYMVTTLSLGSTTRTIPTTKAGQLLTAFVQTFGTTLALAAFSPTGAEKRAAATQEASVQLAILERLDRIATLLEQKPA